MAVKNQFMIGVDALTRDRLDALRIVLGVSRAEVARPAMERGAIPGMERTNAIRLGRLYELAGTLGYTSWTEYVRDLVEKYPKVIPSLETLETLPRPNGQ